MAAPSRWAHSFAAMGVSTNKYCAFEYDSPYSVIALLIFTGWGPLRLDTPQTSLGG